MSSERDIQNLIRLRLTSMGLRMFRNNTGVLKDERGRRVAFGLCVGSSDLIGWTPRNGIAVFTAVEVKRPGRKPTEQQRKFIDAVNAAGGIGIVATSAEEAAELIRQAQIAGDTP